MKKKRFKNKNILILLPKKTNKTKSNTKTKNQIKRKNLLNFFIYKIIIPIPLIYS